MSFPRPTQQQQQQQPPQHTVEITIISAKHLKNVNYKSGPLKPYVIFWVDPDHKLTTKSDDFSNTKPVWNQRFSLPVPTQTRTHTHTHTSLSDVILTLELFHSKSSETPKPYIGSAQVRLGIFLTEPGVKSFDLLRPSGRPQGKIKLNVSIKEVDNYQFAPGNSGYFYSSTPNYSYGGYSRSPAVTPVLPPVQTTENYSVRTGYPHSMGYYPGFYSPPPPNPAPNPAPTVMRSFSDRNMTYGTPSAPVDYSPYEVRSRGGVSGHGFGTGLGVGAVAGGLAGLALDDGLKYEEGKIAAERVEDNYLGSSSVKDDFSEYGAEY